MARKRSNIGFTLAFLAASSLTAGAASRLPSDHRPGAMPNSLSPDRVQTQCDDSACPAGSGYDLYLHNSGTCDQRGYVWTGKCYERNYVIFDINHNPVESINCDSENDGGSCPGAEDHDITFTSTHGTGVCDELYEWWCCPAVTCGSSGSSGHCASSMMGKKALAPTLMSEQTSERFMGS